MHRHSMTDVQTHILRNNMDILSSFFHVYNSFFFMFMRDHTSSYEQPIYIQLWWPFGYLGLPLRISSGSRIRKNTKKQLA